MVRPTGVISFNFRFFQSRKSRQKMSPFEKTTILTKSTQLFQQSSFFKNCQTVITKAPDRFEEDNMSSWSEVNNVINFFPQKFAGRLCHIIHPKSLLLPGRGLPEESQRIPKNPKESRKNPFE